jgi:hypothetical protein
MSKTKQLEIHLIHKNAIYTPRQIANLQLIPSSVKDGGWAKHETIIRYILIKKIKSINETESKNGSVFRLVKGSEIIKFLEKYRPDYEIPIKK